MTLCGIVTRAPRRFVNLKMAFSAAKSFQAEQDALVTNPDELGYSPEAGNRYVYAFELGGNPKAIVPASPRQDQAVTSTEEAKSCQIDWKV